VTTYTTAQAEYEVRARRISGNRAERLEQIDAGIQELIDIKGLECATWNPNVRFLAVPRPRSHGQAMLLAIVVMLIVLVAVLGVRSTCAQTAAAAPQAPSTEWHAGAFVDIGYLKDFNAPANHLFRTRGTTPRVDETDVNMAAAYLKKSPSAASRWGIELTAQDGHDSDGFGFSPTAPNLAGAGGLRRFGPTNVSYLVPAGRGVTVQGGIFSSLVGYDALYAKDNLTYTRPWGADFTPYFMLGGTVSYPVSDRFAVAGFVVNGYFHLAHANDAPNYGGQVSYALTARVSIKETALLGSHQADTSLANWRVLSDTILERKAGRMTAAAELQLATERVVSIDERASWVAVQLPVRLSLSGPWSVTMRPEFARDRLGRYTSVRQTVSAFTSMMEYRKPLREAQVIVRIEYRYDRSTGPGGGFFSGAANSLTPGQQILAGELMLSIDHVHNVTQ
jgi:Putative beta-barrel porin-2, OmpL-like. bbp2